MKKLSIFILLFSLFSNADEYLIQEMENLKASLSFDDPARGELTLRLADLYFETSIKEGVDISGEGKRKALSLYQSSLNGSDGLIAVEGKLRIKVQFQVARLLDKLKKHKEAMTLFEEIYNNPKVMKDLRRESAFSLAEWNEKEAQFEKANKYYNEAINLCNSIDTCNYAHYKRGWLLYKETKLEEAISELKLSLWDSKGQVREKVLRDYLLFTSNKATDGISELRELEKLEEKTNDNTLIQQLAESFYTAGNAVAGSNLLAFVDKRLPDSYYKIRLLEHHYGMRSWDKFSHYLGSLEKRAASELPQDKEKSKEANNILKRLIVQLDAEVVNNKEANSYLLRSIDLYLKYYPRDEMRKKMISGWLKAQHDEQKKIDRLATWINEESELEQEIKLRQNRLALAQKLKLSSVVIEEAQTLASKTKEQSQSREFSYVAAREFYEQKNNEKAKILFKELAKQALKTGKADKWAILSKNLLLDIYNSEKNYKAIEEEVALWSNNQNLQKDSQVSKELTSLSQVAKQAKFERAASLGESSEALETFYSFCMNGEFSQKSCLNAKVLSVKLSDQEKLITLLEKEGDEKSLMNEYELMGRFVDAAKLQEKIVLRQDKTEKNYLKIALLYELGFDFANRDRILNLLAQKIRKTKKMDDELEPLIYTTLSEAGLISERSLTLPWSLKTKIKLANRLEEEKPLKDAQKIILSQTSSVGPSWGKLILQKVQPLDKKQRKISFYGRRSKSLFAKRTKSLQTFNDEAKSYLNGAMPETRIYLLDMLVKAYHDFSEEIKSTPLPKDLDEETLNNVKMNLSQMAQPFEKVADDYKRLLDEELLKINDTNEKTRVSENISKESIEDYSSLIKIEKKSYIQTVQFDPGSAKEILKTLNKAPKNSLALKNLEEYYQINQSPRLAAYFKGRLESLKQ